MFGLLEFLFIGAGMRQVHTDGLLFDGTTVYSGGGRMIIDKHNSPNRIMEHCMRLTNIDYLQCKTRVIFAITFFDWSPMTVGISRSFHPDRHYINRSLMSAATAAAAATVIGQHVSTQSATIVWLYIDLYPACHG